jgi:glutathione S-transferase
MKLYFSYGSCSLAIRIIIHEIGLNAEFEAVDLKAKITAAGENFLKINPKGAVPVLVTDENEILTENAIIQQYLADQYQANTLLPALGHFKRYRVLEWLNFITTELHKGCGPLFNSAVPTEMKESLFKPALKNKLAYVEKNLQQNAFLLGEQFTLADAYLFVILFWLPHLKIELAEWPELTRYYKNLQQRAAIKRSLDEEKRNNQ